MQIYLFIVPATQGSNYIISRSPKNLFHLYSRPTSNCCTDTNKTIRTCCEVRIHQEYFFGVDQKEGEHPPALCHFATHIQQRWWFNSKALVGIVGILLQENQIEFWGHASNAALLQVLVSQIRSWELFSNSHHILWYISRVQDFACKNTFQVPFYYINI